MDSAALAHIVRAAANEAWDDARRHLDTTDNAAVAGSLLPSLLSALGIDPAIAGGVVLTTVTDVAGFFTFLGLATLAYG